MSESTKQQRWHDNRGELSLAVELLESIPPALLPYIAAGLTQKTDREFDATAILNGLKSLGKDRIMGLHQSHKKRRGYDQSPELHRIVNTFMVLPEEEQESVAAQFVDFTSMMVDYMATCDAVGTAPQEADLHKMRQYYVEEGTQAVQSYLSKVHEAYNQLLLSEEKLSTPEVVLDTQGELHLRPHTEK